METLEKGEKRFQKTGNVCVWCDLHPFSITTRTGEARLQASLLEVKHRRGVLFYYPLQVGWSGVLVGWCGRAGTARSAAGVKY